MSRVSSSFSSPSRCSFHTFIGLAVILCVYFTLQSSRSLDDKTVVSEHIKTILPSRKLDYSNDQSVDPPHKTYDIPSHPKEETTLLDPSESDSESEKLQGLAQHFEINWGQHRGKFHEDGELLTLSLDKESGSGFQSKNEYLFAKIDIYIKLIPDNAAGTVTTFYMSSNTTKHDEIDFEFLGNVSGQPYTIHTNIYSQGKGKREKQFYLWFDPTEDFHKYSILWNPTRIVFFVDGTPIREFKNMEAYGVPFPKSQPMRIFSSLWNADDWATQGGRVHIDWTKAPFVASYKDFSVSACVWSSGSSSCGSNLSSEYPWITEELDSKSLKKMKWVQENYMTYNYCNDKKRFQEEGLPKECTIREPKRKQLY